MGEADQKFLEELAEKDEDEVVGKSFSAIEDIRMIPDILKNGDKYYFPVFSSREEMGDYAMIILKFRSISLKL